MISEQARMLRSRSLLCAQSWCVSASAHIAPIMRPRQASTIFSIGLSPNSMVPRHHLPWLGGYRLAPPVEQPEKPKHAHEQSATTDIRPELGFERLGLHMALAGHIVFDDL